MSALMLLSAAQAFYYVCSTRFIYPKFVDSSAAAVPIDPVIPVIFNSTIAVSLALLTQIICEVLALFSNS